MNIPGFLQSKTVSSQQSAELVRGGPGDGRIAVVPGSTAKIQIPSTSGGFHGYRRANRATAAGHAAFEYEGRK
jgi:hypothetical protein